MSEQNETVRYWRCVDAGGLNYISGASYCSDPETENAHYAAYVTTSARCHGNFIPWTPAPGDFVECGGGEVCLHSFVAKASVEIWITKRGEALWETGTMKPVLHRAPAPPAPPASPASAASGNTEPTKCPRCQKTTHKFQRVEGGAYLCDACYSTQAPAPASQPARIEDAAFDAEMRQPSYIGASARHTAAMLERQRVAAKCAEQSLFTASDTDGLLAQGAKFIKRRDLLEELAALEPSKPMPKRVDPQPVRCGIWSREI